VGGRQSGYDFSINADPLDVPVPPSPSQFLLGTFNHQNFPIFFPAIIGIQLKITADVAVDGNPVAGNPLTFLFDFEHLETLNDLDPCPDGGPNGVGVNINRCADRLTFSINPTSQFFFLGSDRYTLTLKGFIAVGGDPLNDPALSEFWTAERQETWRGSSAAWRATFAKFPSRPRWLSSAWACSGSASPRAAASRADPPGLRGMTEGGLERPPSFHVFFTFTPTGPSPAQTSTLAVKPGATGSAEVAAPNRPSGAASPWRQKRAPDDHGCAPGLPPPRQSARGRLGRGPRPLVRAVAFPSAFRRSHNRRYG